MTTTAAKLLGAALALALTCAAAQAGDLVVIVSARSSVDALRPDQVAAIFLGQSARFPGGAWPPPSTSRSARANATSSTCA